MKMKQSVCIIAIALLVVGCGGAERKANRSEAKVNDERLDLINKYQKCMDKAGGDSVKTEECDTYRKSAEALK